jgi:pyridoxal phosphate enzyme (YggS family)
MAVTRNRIARNLQRVREAVAEACARARRDPGDVRIVAVTKSVELDAIRRLLDLGLTELGESRAQQLLQRADEVAEILRRRRSEPPRPVRWHMVGHLQRNKIKGVLEAAGTIHSVDSLRLAEDLQHHAQARGECVDVLMQVNCSQEAQKFGVAVGAAVHLGELIADMSHLRLVGLMTMGPLTNDPNGSRLAFARLRELFEEMKKDDIGGVDFRHLSMGMSSDYPVAVEEGATILRIGTALFE